MRKYKELMCLNTLYNLLSSVPNSNPVIHAGCGAAHILRARSMDHARPRHTRSGQLSLSNVAAAPWTGSAFRNYLLGVCHGGLWPTFTVTRLEPRQSCWAFSDHTMKLWLSGGARPQRALLLVLIYLQVVFTCFYGYAAAVAFPSRHWGLFGTVRTALLVSCA